MQVDWSKSDHVNFVNDVVWALSNVNNRILGQMRKGIRSGASQASGGIFFDGWSPNRRQRRAETFQLANARSAYLTEIRGCPREIEKLDSAQSSLSREDRRG